MNRVRAAGRGWAAAGLAAAVLSAAGCQSDPYTDGRLWRRGVEGNGRRSVSFTTNRVELSTSVSVGSDVRTVGAAWGDGGAAVGRGAAVQPPIVRRTGSTTVGSTPNAPLSRVSGESLGTVNVQGRSMESGRYSETGTRVGVGGG